LCVHPKTRLRYALQSTNGTLAIWAILEHQSQCFSNSCILNIPVCNITLTLENICDATLENAVWQANRIVMSRIGVAQPRQEVSDRIGHCHVFCLSWAGFFTLSKNEDLAYDLPETGWFRHLLLVLSRRNFLNLACMGSRVLLAARDL